MAVNEPGRVERLVAEVLRPPEQGGGGLPSVCGQGGSWAANEWVRLHPGVEMWCCYGAATDSTRCTCWRPTYTLEQQPPRQVENAADLRVRGAKCGDCAFRPDSRERADPTLEEDLYSMAERGRAFWCHQGMRRPLRWEHPEGMVVEGDPDDWSPPIIGGVPYQADGSPAVLCAGWAAVAVARWRSPEERESTR